jgi:hypothetical protein
VLELDRLQLSCLRNLAAYKRPKAPGRYPRSRSAAVLVALFVGRGGDLYVLLSRLALKTQRIVFVFTLDTYQTLGWFTILPWRYFTSRRQVGAEGSLIRECSGISPQCLYHTLSDSNN